MIGPSVMKVLNCDCKHVWFVFRRLLKCAAFLVEIEQVNTRVLLHYGRKSNQIKVRSSYPEVLCKKGVLKNFAKFTGKHLWKSVFFDKVAGLRLFTVVQVCSFEFCKIFKNTFFYRTPPLATFVNSKHFTWLHLTIPFNPTIQWAKSSQ